MSHRKMLMPSPQTVSRVDSRIDVHSRLTFLKINSLPVLSAARKIDQEDVQQVGTSMAGAAEPGRA